MKKRLRPAIVASLLIISLVSCAATPAQVAYRTIGITVNTVDTGMKLWADYVVAGRATAEQEASVRRAHDRYRTAARDLGVVLEAANTAPTPEQLSSAAAALIELIQQFTGKMVTR